MKVFKVCCKWRAPEYLLPSFLPSSLIFQCIRLSLSHFSFFLSVFLFSFPFFPAIVLLTNFSVPPPSPCLSFSLFLTFPPHLLSFYSLLFRGVFVHVLFCFLCGGLTSVSRLWSNDRVRSVKGVVRQRGLEEKRMNAACRRHDDSRQSPFSFGRDLFVESFWPRRTVRGPFHKTETSRRSKTLIIFTVNIFVIYNKIYYIIIYNIYSGTFLFIYIYIIIYWTGQAFWYFIYI